MTNKKLSRLNDLQFKIAVLRQFLELSLSQRECIKLSLMSDSTIYFATNPSGELKENVIKVLEAELEKMEKEFEEA